MNLTIHYRVARIIFWFAQLVGLVTIVTLIFFVGGNLLSELIAQDITIREDYSIFLFFLCDLLLAGTIILSWYRKRLGPVLIIALTVLIGIIWGREDINIILLHLPILFSGILLLFYIYYKEWILKKKA